jgi:hypothetical protein
MSHDPPRRRFYPQRLQYAFARLGGEPEAEFKPFSPRLVAGIIGGLLATLVGLAGIVYGLLELEWEIIVGALLVGVIGAAIAWQMWRVWGQKLFVCSGGLVRQRGLRVECCSWSELKEVVQKKGTSRYQLVRRQGEDWSLDANDTQQIDQFIERIRALTEKHSVRWKVVEDKSK